MKIGLYSPYFDGVGGGERYMLTAASVLSRNHTVVVFWDNGAEVKTCARTLGIDISRVSVVQNVFTRKNLFERFKKTSGYDLILFLSDGSIPVSFAKHTVIHFQVPFIRLPYNPLKRFFYHGVVVNSRFTKENLDTRYSRGARVIYPPVETGRFTAGVPKKNLIISIGRFHPLKKQDVLIRSFLSSRKLKTSYRLILAGSVRDEDRQYLDRLKKMSQGRNIEIRADLTDRELVGLLSSAAIYWHAAGFGETEPSNQEHFGIAPVEAMAAGCVPVVYAGGGLPEIVTDGESGFLVKTEAELVTKTETLAADNKLLESVAFAARQKSKMFDGAVFTAELKEFLSGVCGHEV